MKRPLLSLLAGLMLMLQIGGPLTAQVPQYRPEARAAAIVEQTAEASRVHVMLLVYGPRHSFFGAACRNDVRAFKSMLEQGFGTKHERLVFHDFTGLNPQTGLDWAPDQITAYLSAFQLAANESIVVFHSGHGEIADPSRPEETQTLVLDRGTLNRGDLVALLRGKQPRALILLTDCCSSIVGGAGAGRSFAGITNAATFNAQTIQALFLRVTGRVSLTAAQVGTEALVGYEGPNPAGAGSAFTVAMLRLFCDQSRTYQTWKDLFPVLQNETFQASQVPNRTPHRAHAFVIAENEAGTLFPQ